MPTRRLHSWSWPCGVGGSPPHHPCVLDADLRRLPVGPALHHALLSRASHSRQQTLGPSTCAPDWVMFQPHTVSLHWLAPVEAGLTLAVASAGHSSLPADGVKGVVAPREVVPSSALHPKQLEGAQTRSRLRPCLSHPCPALCCAAELSAVWTCPARLSSVVASTQACAPQPRHGAALPHQHPQMRLWQSLRRQGTKPLPAMYEPAAGAHPTCTAPPPWEAHPGLAQLDPRGHHPLASARMLGAST
jgi:hypothetical protein